MTVYYTSNDPSTGFDATTTGNQATSFANKTGTWQVGTVLTALGHTHTYGSTTQADGDVALATGVSAVADMEVVYAQKLSAGWVQGVTHPAVGPVLRSNAAGTANYAVVISHSGSALVGYIFVKNGGSYSVVTGPVTISKTFTAGDVLWYRAQANGTTIRFRIWKDGTAEPGSWDVSVVDGTITAAGYAGLYNATDTLANGTISLAVDELQILSVGGGTLTVNNPGTVIAGSPMTVSGTYSGSAPTALDYQVDGGSWTAASSPTISGGTYSFSVTAPSAGSHTIGVRDHNDTSTAITSGSFTSTALTQVAPNNAAIVYSPYNWSVSSGNAITPNAGAYFSTLFTGTTCTLNCRHVEV